MPNEFLTTKNIARQTLPRLIENLVFPNLVYRDFSNTFQKQGDTIRVRKPVVLTAEEFDKSTGTSAQDVKEESVDVTLNHLATVDVEFGALEMATNVDDLNRLFLEPAAVALAQKINSDGLSLYKDVPYFGGVPGTTPDGLDDFAAITKLLNDNKVPMSQRRAIWDSAAHSKFIQIEGLVHLNESGTPTALREAEIGRIYGLDNYMSQAVKTHTQGTAISGNKTIAVAAAAVKGATSISVDSGAAAGTLKAGDIVKIGSYYYNVAADVEAISATAASVSLVQPLKAAVADGDAITLVTYVSGKTGYTANLAFHQNAFAYVTRPLTVPAGVECYVTNYNGISLRVIRGYDMKYKKDMLSMDVLYGYKTMYPEMAVCYAG
ncbi:MAG: P22 phage major capsid protein family protein [Oscillospiraceae bacterium]|nr:P22 phage major capsid protein family protein [Oscillospiraceae bacterium]